MRIHKAGLTALTILATIAAASTGVAEVRIAKKALPPAVRKTADAQAKGATVRDYTKDNEDGHLEYEVEMMAGGRSKDVSIAPDGTLLEVERQVWLHSLPASVRAALNAKAGKGRITKVESITKHGQIVAYEAQVWTAGRHSEIQVGPNGQALNHEE